VLTVGSLFSGIGGFDLGFERAGMRTVWFCEQDAYCQRVLARHWPGVPCHPDVRVLVADASSVGRREEQGLVGGLRPAGCGSREGTVQVQVPRVDVICGGFPCQDISLAGDGAGIDGARSGLWSEYARLVGELRPRYVVVENVSALLGRGLGRVLGDLSALGYDAEWDCIPASAVGAPHQRDRVWLVAYPDGRRLEVGAQLDREAQQLDPADGRIHAGDTLTDYVTKWPTPRTSDSNGPGRHGTGGLDLRTAVAEAERWPTPVARDWKGSGLAGQLPTELAKTTPGQLNPTWVEWLMGFPLGWTDCDPSATPSSPRSPSGLVPESSSGKAA
jgi:DNA-cytosine methyltransferase